MSRHRVKIDSSEDGYTELKYYPVGSPPWTGYGVTHNFKNDYQAMDDEPHKNYRSRIKAGELIIGNLYAITHSESCGGGSINASFSGGGSWHLQPNSLDKMSATRWAFQTYGKPDIPSPSLHLDAEDIKLQCLANVDPGQFDFTEDFLSMRENLAMLRNPLEGFKDVVDFYRARRYFKSGASAWAYYRFAATPFLRSIHELYESFHTQNKHVKPFVRLRAQANGKDAATVSGNYTVGDITYAGSKEWSIEIKAGLFYKVTKPRSGLAYKYSLRYKDLPAGFWAVVPYSFMIDRIFSVSNLSKAVMNITDPTVIVEGGYVTTKTTGTDKVRVVSRAPSGGWTFVVNGDTVQTYNKDVRRELWTPTLSSLPIPSVNFKGLVSDATRIADLAALIIQRVK